MYHPPAKATPVFTVFGLPFTGLTLTWIVIAGATMLVAGFALLRIGRHVRYREDE